MIVQPEHAVRFRDRREAGRILAASLRLYGERRDLIVLGLPRGGVPVAYEVAAALRAPLDVFIVRKLGVPGHEELAMGAIASGGARVLNEDILRYVSQPEEALAYATEMETRELQRRELEYRDGRLAPDLRGKTVIVVDDGLATGATMRAAVMALREHGVAACIVGVPVASPDTCAELRELVDEIVCVCAPPGFQAVGQFYDNFSQTTDEEVHELLARAAEEARR
jgi:predicted phosphoribosyltransferase